jgi:hypothetical protein
MSLSGFGIRVIIMASQNVFRSIPFFSVLWNSLRRIGISSYIKFYENSAVNLPGAGSFSLLVDSLL